MVRVSNNNLILGFNAGSNGTVNLDGGWTADGESNGTHNVTFSFGTPVPDGAGYELIEVTATAAPNDLPGFFARLNLGAN